MPTNSNYKRRSFLQLIGLGYLSTGLISCKKEIKKEHLRQANAPFVLSTWSHKIDNAIAYDAMTVDHKTVVSALVSGIMNVENNPDDASVGYGGRPDRSGQVTLDACIMNEKGEAGSVTYLQNIKNPIAVAQLVMEETPHVMLSGVGAYKFAIDNGFPHTDLLTQASEKAWEQWLLTSQYQPEVNIENHDTVGMLAVDADNNIAGGCSTSGMAYKMEGRVGDSPIIGAGLYVDNEIGAATATGVGELVMKTVGSFLVVELMRQGHSAQAACEIAVRRIVDRYDVKEKQVGFIALSKSGDIGAYSIYPGFIYTLTDATQNSVIEALSYYSK